MVAGIVSFTIALAIIGGVIFTIVQRHDEPVDRGAAVRRLYIYLVALISYIAALFALDGIVRTLADVWLEGGGLYTINADTYIREQLARTAGLLVVTALVFLLHWGFVQGRRFQAGEANAALRKLFLYIALGFTIGFALVDGYWLLVEIANLALGRKLAESVLWPSEWLHWTVMIAACLGLAGYLQNTLRGDGDYGAETNRAARSWRRLYFLVACLSGLAVLLWGATSLLDVMLQTLFDQFTTLLSTPSENLQPWSSPIAQILLGALLLRGHWQQWQTLTKEPTTELSSAIRRLYLYAAVVIGAIFALVGAAVILDALLLRSFGGTDDSLLELLRQNRMALAAILPGIIAWRWYWQQLQRESQLFGESHEANHVRRIYYYAVAATGLALLWIGAGELVQVLLDWLMNGDLLGQGFWHQPLANGLSLLAVGAPIWSLHWQTVQPIARQTSEAGAVERGSLPRRIYLYGIALSGALVILYYLAQVVYRLFLLLLGDPDAAFFSAQTADEIARSLIAAALWGVHMLALRTDVAMGGQAPAAQTVDQRVELEARVAQLERELQLAKEELANL